MSLAVAEIIIAAVTLVWTVGWSGLTRTVGAPRSAAAAARAPGAAWAS